MLLGALAAVTALLAGCSSSPGPLGSGGTDGTQCATYREGQPVTIGLYVFQNAGTSPVTVQSVSLPSDAHGLRMTSAWLVPMYHDPKNGNTDTIGVGWPYPPSTRPMWPQRRPAVAGVVGPGQTLNLVFGLIRTSAHNGTSAGPTVVYTANGNTYTMQMAVSLVASANCDAQPA